MSECIQRGIAAAVPRLSGTFHARRQVVVDGRLSYGLTLLFIVMIYTSPALLFKPLAAVGPAQIVAGLALGALCFEKIRNRQGLWVVWPNTHALFAFAWTAALSCLTAAWARLSFESTLDLLKYCAIYVLLVNSVTTWARLRGALLTMVLAGMFPALGTLRNYVTGNIHEGERVHWVGIFANSNDLAYAILLLVPLAVALAGSPGLVRRLFFWGVVGLFVGTIYVTYSRGTLIGLLVVLLFLGFRHRTGFVRATALSMLGASLIFVGYFWTRQEGFTNLSDFTLKQRLVTIQTGLKMFVANPVLGVGVGGSVAAFPKYAPPDLDFSQSLVIHNTFVQSLSEVGIVGCAFFTIFIVTGFTQARRLAAIFGARGDYRTAGLISAMEVALWGFVVCGLFGPYMMSWFPYILVALLAAAQKLAADQPAKPADQAAEP